VIGRASVSAKVRAWLAELIPLPVRERGREGPHAQFGEDRILEEIFRDRPAGHCVEVGAYDGRTGSATLLFESKGWKCLLVEPIPERVEEIRTHRRCIVKHCAASSQEGERSFFVAETVEQMSTLESDDSHHRWIRELGGNVREITVRTARLDDLLDEVGFPELEFVTIDTEGHELEVLRGLSLDRFKPRIVIVEEHLIGRGSGVVGHMAARGYVNFRRTGVNDWYAHESDAELVRAQAVRRFKRTRQIERVQDRWLRLRDVCMRFLGLHLPPALKQAVRNIGMRLGGRG